MKHLSILLVFWTLILSLFGCSDSISTEFDNSIDDELSKADSAKISFKYFFPFDEGDTLSYEGSSYSENDGYLIYDVDLDEQWIIHSIDFIEDSLKQNVHFQVQSERNSYYFHCETPYSQNCSEEDSTYTENYNVQLQLLYDENLVIFDYPENVIIDPPFPAGRGVVPSLDVEAQYNFNLSDSTEVFLNNSRSPANYRFSYLPNKGLVHFGGYSGAMLTKWDYMLYMTEFE